MHLIKRYGVAHRLQTLKDGFGLRLELVAFNKYAGWLLTRRAQAHFTVSFNYCSIFSSIQFNYNFFIYTPAGSAVVKRTLSIREVRGSIPGPVKSAQCRQWLATAATFLRSCVAQAKPRRWAPLLVTRFGVILRV